MNAALTVAFFLIAAAIGVSLYRKKYLATITCFVAWLYLVFYQTEVIGRTLMGVAPKSDPGGIALFGSILVGMLTVIVVEYIEILLAKRRRSTSIFYDPDEADQH